MNVVARTGKKHSAAKLGKMGPHAISFQGNAANAKQQNAPATTDLKSSRNNLLISSHIPIGYTIAQKTVLTVLAATVAGMLQHPTSMAARQCHPAG